VNTVPRNISALKSLCKVRMAVTGWTCGLFDEMKIWCTSLWLGKLLVAFKQLNDHVIWVNLPYCLNEPYLFVLQFKYSFPHGN